MKEFVQYLVYEAHDDAQELSNIIDAAIKESATEGIIERPQGGICVTEDADGKKTFYQATICEKDPSNPKFDF